MVRVTILVFNSHVRVLIDSGASHSFISYDCSRALGLRVEPLSHPLVITTPISGLSRAYTLEIAEYTVVFDLVLLDMTEFDIIIGMDWPPAFQACTDCRRWRVTFRMPEGGRFIFVGDGHVTQTPSPMRSVLVKILAED